MTLKAAVKDVLFLAALALCSTSPCRAEDPHQHGDHSAEHDHHDHHHDEEPAHSVLSENALRASAITTARAGEVVLRPQLQLPGRIYPSEHGIAHIIPRFPGIVRKGRKRVGDTVAEGEVMAIIESNHSLQPYELRSQIAGTVIDGHLLLGEFVSNEEPVFVIANTSEVWVDMRVPKTKAGTIAVGRRVVIEVPETGVVAHARIDYLAPFLDDVTQTQLARAKVPNPEGALLPGTFVTVDLVLEEIPVRIAIRAEAVQSMHEQKVIFVRNGDTFSPRAVKLGRADAEWIEVVEGIAAGEEYASQNSFIVKADILKAGAAHDHDH